MYTHYVLDVLWGQPIKLIQVVSASEFHEYWWNNFGFIFFCPLHLLHSALYQVVSTVSWKKRKF